jgi:hypothetical protein
MQPPAPVNPTLTIPTPPSQPIQTLYQSARILPQLPQASNPPSTSQPFLGFSWLAPPVATQQANQARLTSAAISIPRQQQLPRRGVRHRPASRTQRSATPTLGRRSGKAKIEDCLLEGSQNLIRIQARVYPPVVCITSILTFLCSQF